ncbi:hypothetical protein FISHEDRAFT_73207 [Fistulina hepatica ATCC 64428]|uniref:Uncharacterized protein n=1 Tax=Fistulina hepatica ATCC 64428 TaxID=1128425 RepID=A0A0D7ADD0_9AGAR|nr:hypothetical protein FISHEDRAFT_73207 [Fistulina hepatica ATCC 64428]
MPRVSTTKSSTSSASRAPRKSVSNTSRAESPCRLAGSSKSQHATAANNSEAFTEREYSGGKARTVRKAREARFTPAPTDRLGNLVRIAAALEAAEALLSMAGSRESVSSAAGASTRSSLKETKLFSYMRNKCDVKHRDRLVKTFREKRFASFDVDYIENGTSARTLASRANSARRLISDEMTRTIELELNPFVGHFTPTRAVCIPCQQWNLLDNRHMYYSGNLVGRHMYGKSGSKKGINRCHSPQLFETMINTIEEAETSAAHMITHLGPFFERQMPVLEYPETATPAEVMEYYDACCQSWDQQWQEVQRYVVDVIHCNTCVDILETAKTRAQQ